MVFLITVSIPSRSLRRRFPPSKNLQPAPRLSRRPPLPPRRPIEVYLTKLQPLFIGAFLQFLARARTDAAPAGGISAPAAYDIMRALKIPDCIFGQRSEKTGVIARGKKSFSDQQPLYDSHIGMTKSAAKRTEKMPVTRPRRLREGRS